MSEERQNSTICLLQHSSLPREENRHNLLISHTARESKPRQFMRENCLTAILHDEKLRIAFQKQITCCFSFSQLDLIGFTFSLELPPFQHFL